MGILSRPKRQPSATHSGKTSLTDLENYLSFRQLNGDHSFKDAVLNGFVDYQVRKRAGGKIVFFNFDLAKEMGLIPKDHPKTMNRALQEMILETFAIVVINEWDIQQNRKFPADEIKPNRYMATRYLQLQHPDRRGMTSGDGRGIWNGEFKARGTTWDVSSSGTGATCLSPAAAIEKRAFKTGDTRVCYGNGYNFVDDGLSAALMSEIFHRNGISTERTLTVIEFEKGSSINVRAGKNLLRPSHFFLHLKQANLKSLRSAVDYFIDRQANNKVWHSPSSLRAKYTYFSEQMAIIFSSLAARFESEYIFCWLDWDGDNILADGGIIDYGSVRQFGLFHDEYRYDDGDRFSTKLIEQKRKARYLVQTFAQMTHFMITGRKKNIRKFIKDPLLQIFDLNFEHEMKRLFLEKIGLSSADQDYLTKKFPNEVKSFQKTFTYFERKQSKKGIYSVPDGVRSDAVFSVRDGLRELPKLYLKNDHKPVDPKVFIEVMKSSYAKRSDLLLTRNLTRKMSNFQNQYLSLLQCIAQKRDKKDLKSVLLETTMRSSLINREGRITGNGILSVTQEALKLKKRWQPSELQILLEYFIYQQVLDPNRRPSLDPTSIKTRIQKEVKRVCQFIWDYREGI